MKKIIAILLTLVMVLGLFAGCDQAAGNETQGKDPTPTGDQGTVSGGSETTGSDEPVKLTVWFKENLRIEDMETNEMTKWLEEQANVDLEFSLIPSSDMATKVNMALTVGNIEDLPDIIINNGATAADLQAWGEAGTIIPLNEYFEDPELSKNYREACERVGGVDLLKETTTVDGYVYGFPKYMQSYGNEYPYKTWIYKPWLDQLGEDIPTTTEEFYQLLKKVANTDMNGNGKKDEIAYLGNMGERGGWFSYLMNAFTYAGDDMNRVVENGKVSLAYTSDEWKQGLAYIKTLFDEGIIPSETLTMDNDQVKALLASEEQVAFCTTYYIGDSMDWICIEPLIGPEGVQYASFRPTAASKSYFYITANCENPEAAFRVGDLMCSEHIGIMSRWGLEGVDWDYAENVPDADKKYDPTVEGFDLSIIIYDDANFWHGNSITNHCWRQGGPYVVGFDVLNGRGIPKGGEDSFEAVYARAQLMYQQGGWAPEEVVGTLVFSGDESSAVSEIGTNLKAAANEFWAGVFAGTKDLEKDWDAYIENLKAIGLDTYVETIQAVYDRMNG